MKTVAGSVGIARLHGRGPERVRIEVKDERHNLVARADMTLDSFARAVTGMGDAPTELHLWYEPPGASGNAEPYHPDPEVHKAALKAQRRDVGP